MQSPFKAEVFRKLAVKFKVSSGVTEKDERGNTRSVGEDLTVNFKVGTPSAQITKDFGSTNCDESLLAYCLTETGMLDRRIKPGDMGEAEYNGYLCDVEVRSLGQSSIIPVTQVLGEKYLLLLRFQSRGGNASSL